MWISILALFLIGCSGPSEAEVTVARVVDGDTIEVFPEVYSESSVRLIGMDAPEEFDDSGAEPYASEATAFAGERLAGETVRLEFDEEIVDDYGRLLAYVYLDGEMFNEVLVEEGFAQVATFPPNTRYFDRFEAAQERARGAGRGIWGLPESEACVLRDRGNGIGGVCSQRLRRASQRVSFSFLLTR
ncbi:MAG: thermonuclease family protein [Rubrobacter sp.]|nr:thermonuclease family protein [Rubrobacter sp.]